ncbi:hypothetical protein MHYP_G00311410 [Metynnis hypsauchen]
MQAMTDTDELKFLSWNVNGLKNKIDNFNAALLRLNPDVVFLQETRIAKLSDILTDRAYRYFITSYSSRIRGVAVLVKKDKLLLDCEPEVYRDPKGCYILVNCNLLGVKYSLVSVYNAKDKPNLLNTLVDTLEINKKGVLVIGGDFNTALDPRKDSTNSQRKDNTPRQNLCKFIKSFNLQDTWRVQNPDEKDYTYVVKSRLDYLFIPKTESLPIMECGILDESISDHKPVSLTLSHRPKETNTTVAHSRKRKLANDSGESSTNWKQRKV